MIARTWASKTFEPVPPPLFIRRPGSLVIRRVKQESSNADGRSIASTKKDCVEVVR